MGTMTLRSSSHRIDYSKGFIDFFAAKMGGPRKAGQDDYFSF
jgi:hypothetical protein